MHSIPHDHEPDIESVAVDKMKSDLSTLSASNPTKKLKEIYRDYVQSEELPADDYFQIPMLSTCRSQMYRARCVNRPPLPKTRADINLQGQWTTTKQGERFLLHQEEDMLIFATDDNIIGLDLFNWQILNFTNFSSR